RHYVDGLGFTITHRWVDEGKLRWCWLARDEVAVMLQEFKTEGHDSWRPEGKVGVGVSLCIVCKDALAAYRELKARGVAATEPRVGNGMWVTEIADPDGYQLAFESPTDAREETRLSEVVPG